MQWKAVQIGLEDVSINCEGLLLSFSRQMTSCFEKMTTVASDYKPYSMQLEASQWAQIVGLNGIVKLNI